MYSDGSVKSSYIGSGQVIEQSWDKVVGIPKVSFICRLVRRRSNGAADVCPFRMRSASSRELTAYN